MKIKDQATVKISETKKIFRNIEHFVQAASLSVVLAFAAWAVTKFPMHAILRNIIIGALAVMVVRMAYEWLKFFNFDRK